jgi:hypothetical protein
MKAETRVIPPGRPRGKCNGVPIASKTSPTIRYAVAVQTTNCCHVKPRNANLTVTLNTPSSTTYAREGTIHPLMLNLRTLDLAAPTGERLAGSDLLTKAHMVSDGDVKLSYRFRELA